MAAFICLIVSFAVLHALGFVFPYFSVWQVSLRAAFGAMFLLTASAHWGARRPDLINMVPSAMPDPGLWVTITGIAEIALAIALQIPPVAPYAAISAAVLLCCLFPANWKATRENLPMLGKPVLPFWPRLSIQLAFIVLLMATIRVKTHVPT